MKFLQKIFKAFNGSSEGKKSAKQPDTVTAGAVPAQRPAAVEDLNKGIIAIVDDGFFVRGEEEETLVRWPDIFKIYCYKHDYITHDLICMVFSLVETHPLRVTEEMAGYQNLLKALWPVFPGTEEPYARWRDSGTAEQGHYTLWKKA